MSTKPQIRRLAPRLTRAQTYCLSAILALACYTGLAWAHPSKLTRLLWSLAAAYLPSYFDGSERTTAGRLWPAWVTAQFWRLLHDYHSVRHIFTTPIDAGRQYIVSTHPHGVYSTHHWTYITGPEFQRRFPAARRRHVGSAIVFRIPLFRDMMLWGGVIDADAKVAAAVLAEGFTLVTLTGGIAEQTRASPGTHHAIVTPRKGIFKLSLQHGVPIIPAYCFGETDSVSTLPWLAGLRARLSDRFRLPLCLSWGRWGTPLPHRVPFTAVFGAPLEVTKPVAHPTEAEVSALQTRYITELRRVFELHKAAAGHADAELTVT